MRQSPALFVLALAVVAFPASATEIIAPGVVGCINLKTAQQYAAYVTSAPNFAKDMLDRATCYVNKDQAEAVRLSESSGYVQYKLLTGHKVWIPASAGTTPLPKPAK